MSGVPSSSFCSSRDGFLFFFSVLKAVMNAENAEARAERCRIVRRIRYDILVSCSIDDLDGLNFFIFSFFFF